jgi:AraC-like DNA-binding protein
MEKRTNQQKIATEPLLAAIKSILLQLDRRKTSRFIVPRPTLREMQQQPKNRQGKRVVMHGARDRTKISLATWPEDAMLEPTHPLLAFIIAGQADLHIYDYLLHCQVGDIIYFPAGTPKFEKISSSNNSPNCSFFWLYPGQAFGEGLECWISRTEAGKYQTSGNLGGCWIKLRLVVHLYNGLADEVLGACQPQLVEDFLRLLLRLISTEIERGKAMPSWGFPVEGEKNDSSTVIENACFYIDEHLDEHLTIATVARHVAVSPATLTRRFRQEVGQSFLDYLSTKRLQKAEALLLDSHLSIAQLGDFVGLQYDQLKRIFIKNHGCTPGEYRTLHKK